MTQSAILVDFMKMGYVCFQSADQAYANYYASVYGPQFKAGGAQRPQYMTANMVRDTVKTLHKGVLIEFTRSVS